MTLDLPQLPVLSTSRLILRPFVLADSPDVYRLVSVRAVADTTLNIPHPYELSMAEQWIGKHPGEFTAREAATFAVTLSGELVGAVTLRLRLPHRRGELGYWIGQAHWGRGYATEAAIAIIDWGFTRLGLHRVHASHLARNPASGRVMQKAGMTHEGVMRDHVLKNGRFEDVVNYGMVASG